MKIEYKYIKQIKEQFANIQNKQDLANLLSFANKILYGNKSKPIKLNALTYYANPSICKNRYYSFSIKKKSGDKRIIHAPSKGLKTILQTLNFVFQCLSSPPKVATGFVTGKSIVDNARKHEGHRYILNLDLKDFFYSFDRNRVKLAFMYEPFNLIGEKEPLAFLLASLCTHPIEVNGETKVVLPQGSPASPILTNILCKKLDRRLNGLAKRFGASYSRYADDITFSSQYNFYNNKEFVDELNRIIEIDQKLNINSKKIRIQKSTFRQEVTGLIVNEKVNVRRRYIKLIRMWLYYWEKYGYDKAEQIFQKDYIADKGHVKKGNAKLIDVLKGKLAFVKMVKGYEDTTYQKLKKRFDSLIKNKIIQNLNKNKVVGMKLENNKSSNSILSESLLEYLEKHLKEFLNKKTYPIIHTPQKTIEILKLFSSNDKHLKYTTHSWEEEKYETYNNFMGKIKDEWEDIDKNLKGLSNRLHAKISNFLFNKKLGQKKSKGDYISWGDKRLKFGWSSKELMEFMKKNPSSSPFDCPIPENIKNLDNDYGKFFRDYVDVFKNEIEFREDTKYFKNMVISLYEDILRPNGFSIEGLENLDGFSCYTDTQQIKNAIKRIFEMFVNGEYKNYNKIIIERSSNLTGQSFHLIKITQLNSFIKRSGDDPKIKEPTGDLGNIIELLKNLADYSIVSKFNNKDCYRINYLSADQKDQIEKIDCNEINGFTHEIKFYL